MASAAVSPNGHALAVVEPPYPDPLDEAAYYGVAGEIVQALAPETEADPVALLLTLLAAAGNAIGPGPYVPIGGKRHGLRLYPVLVGASAKGRKGTAQGLVDAVLEVAAPAWSARRRLSGLSSGEGLIEAVRDPLERQEPVKHKGVVVRYQTVTVDAGVEDKRLLVIEEEFGRTIRVMARENSTLSAVIREAWDGNTLHNATRHNPLTATRPHVTIVGHITRKELLDALRDTEAANGFANRFLWACVRRARFLAHGGALDDGQIAYYGGVLGGVIEDARELGRLARDEETDRLWERAYRLLADERDGLVGAIVQRAEAQVLRLSMLYAALDVSNAIRRPHLEAALALWRYCEDSVLCVFGDQSGDPVVDTIVRALRERPRTQTEIRNLFNRHVPADQLEDTLGLLEDRGQVRQEVIPGRVTGGRPRTVWHLVAEGTA